MIKSITEANYPVQAFSPGKKHVKALLPVKFALLLSALKKRLKSKNKKSYAQSGEDMVLHSIFCAVKTGCYVDVGANNPLLQSNTHFFYKKGWRGINIDALPGSMKPFNRMRPGDINLEVPISDKEETLTYYMFSPSFYNSFNSTQSITYKKFFKGSRAVKTQKLSELLDKHLGNKAIDFLSVDVEDWDLQVLRGNNWDKYRPKVILVEFFSASGGSATDTEVGQYLTDKGYHFLCNTLTNAFFVEQQYFKERFKNNK